jgi:hypothetical protein
LGHAITSKLTIFYRDPVIGLAGTALALKWSWGCNGAAETEHENLPAVAADRYSFDGDPLHFSPRKAV